MFLTNQVQVHYLLAPASGLTGSRFLLAASFPAGTCILFLATGGISCLDGCRQLRSLFLVVKTYVPDKSSAGALSVGTS